MAGMKHLEILIVGREADAALGDDDQVVTIARDADEAVDLIGGQGLGFDAVVIEPRVEEEFLDELRQHRDTSNVAVVKVYDEDQRPDGYDATLHSGYGRRELRDAVHYAMSRRGQI
jgi:hypothetical protein